MTDWELFRKIWETLSYVSTAVVGIIGGFWTSYLVKKYREFKYCIEFDLKAKIIPLNDAIKTKDNYTRDKEGCRIPMCENEVYTHIVEVSLIFNNKGKIRFRLYNIQIDFKTMYKSSETIKFNKETGHLSLKRIFTSGNIVPIRKVKGKPIEKTSFYYIEPGVTQTIRYLALIPTPVELLQIIGKFSLEQKRIFPKIERVPGGLYPHTAVKTYKLPERSPLHADRVFRRSRLSAPRRN